MGKILSVLEKYKLIEKETEKMPSSENPALSSSDTASLDIKDQEILVPSQRAELEESAAEAGSPHLAQDVSDSSPLILDYNKNISLEEIYTFYGLNNSVITDTVFVLENLINALPSELSEYVKKTTLNNILTASSMNLKKLLDDGTNRYNHLNKFAEEYTAQNASDIAALKQEIDKLSAIISSYHQQIKLKESMVNQQLSLIKLEEERLQNVFTFFDK